MREFSPKEQELIRTKLVPGSTLADLFSEDVKKDAKIILTIDPQEDHRFDFYSDKMSAADGNEELVNLISLLKYLDKEGLIIKYPPEASTLRDFEAVEQISFGDFEGKKVTKFVLPANAAYVAKFIRNNDNFTFKANAPLRLLVSNDFKTEQQRQFESNQRNTRIGQWISIGIAIATMSVTIIISNRNWSRNDKSVSEFRAEVQLQQERFKSARVLDSLVRFQLKNELSLVRGKVDSLTKALRPKPNKKKKT
jgi:hypothetical protein